MHWIAKYARMGTRTFLVCVGLMVIGFTDLYAQFSGLFLRADRSNVMYFDLSQVGQSVEGSLFYARVDASKTEGMDHKMAKVRGRTEGHSLRLSSTFFVFDDEQIGVAQLNSNGFTLRFSIDDGTLQEWRFRRVTAGEVNAALRKLAIQGGRAHASWALAWKRHDAMERCGETRLALAHDIVTIQRIESRLDGLTDKVRIVEGKLRVAEDSAQAAHTRAQKARASAQTPDEQYQADNLEYTASSADYQVHSTEYDLESAKSDVTSAREDLKEKRESVEVQRQQIVTDSTWLQTQGMSCPSP